jgi:hypothetical protein
MSDKDLLDKSEVDLEQMAEYYALLPENREYRKVGILPCARQVSTDKGSYFVNWNYVGSDMVMDATFKASQCTVEDIERAMGRVAIKMEMKNIC